MGLEPIVQPLFQVVALAWEAPDPAAFDAVAMTSANAARHGGPDLARFTHLPLFVVGEATATAAGAAGFIDVRIGKGDAAQLGALLRPTSDGKSFRLLHLTGSDHRPIPTVAEVTVIPVYESRRLPPAHLPNADIALIHSPRAGARLAELIPNRSNLQLVAISAAAAQACGAGWAAVEVAAQPRENAMLECLRRLCEASPTF